MRDLLGDISALAVAVHRKQEQTAPAAGLLPLVAHLLLFVGVVRGGQERPLVFDRQHASIGQLRDEVGVEVVC